MERTAADFTIGSLARAAGVGVETIRFYQRKQLLREPARRFGEIRRYGADDLARLRFIRSAQQLGFSLQEIAELLKLDDGTGCREAQVLAVRRLREVRTRIENLRRIESVLDELVAQCDRRRGAVRCPLITSLAERS